MNKQKRKTNKWLSGEYPAIGTKLGKPAQLIAQFCEHTQESEYTAKVCQPRICR